MELEMDLQPLRKNAKVKIHLCTGKKQRLRPLFFLLLNLGEAVTLE